MEKRRAQVVEFFSHVDRQLASEERAITVDDVRALLASIGGAAEAHVAPLAAAADAAYDEHGESDEWEAAYDAERRATDAVWHLVEAATMTLGSFGLDGRLTDGLDRNNLFHSGPTSAGTTADADAVNDLLRLVGAAFECVHSDVHDGLIIRRR